MKISVVTVAYNSARTIAHTLKSFLAQDWPQRELIVVDGGSTDGTQAIVEQAMAKAPGLIRMISERDKGLYDAMNKGFALFQGDAIGFLNSDDAFRDEAVVRAIAETLETRQTAFGHLDFVTDHDSKAITRRWRSAMPPQNGFRSGWMPAHPTFYARRAVAEKVGLFNLSYRTAADYDWMLRACELTGYDLGLIDRVMVNMMAGGQSTNNWQSYAKHNIEALKVRRIHYDAGLVDFAFFAKPLRKLTQFAKRF